MLEIQFSPYMRQEFEDKFVFTACVCVSRPVPLPQLYFAQKWVRYLGRPSLCLTDTKKDNLKTVIHDIAPPPFHSFNSPNHFLLAPLTAGLKLLQTV